MKDVRANGFEEMVYTIEDLLNLFIHIYYKKNALSFSFYFTLCIKNKIYFQLSFCKQGYS